MLILDEPTRHERRCRVAPELWRYMTKVNKEAGTTILLTTHYIEEAEQLCDIALISHGKIIKTGTSDELKKAYKKSSLEDVYLELIGRSELTRNNNGGGVV